MTLQDVFQLARWPSGGDFLPDRAGGPLEGASAPYIFRRRSPILERLDTGLALACRRRVGV